MALVRTPIALSVPVCDFFQICRLCGKKDDQLSSLYQQTTKEKLLSAYVEEYIGINAFPGDGLPEKVCSLCVSIINRFLDFVRNCLETQELLQKVLKDSVKDERKEENTDAGSRNDSHIEFIDTSCVKVDKIETEISEEFEASETFYESNEIKPSASCASSLKRPSEVTESPTTTSHAHSAMLPTLAKRQKLRYSEDELLKAVAAVKRGVSYRKAATLYNVPITTIADKISGKYAAGKSKPGPSSFIPSHLEKKLAEYLVYMEKIGYRINKNEIPFLIKGMLDRLEENGSLLNQERFFKDNKPSSCWVYRFLGRFPELSIRTSENLEYLHSHVSETQIREWFSNLKSFLQAEHNIAAEEFLTEANSHRIFNIDGIGFPLAGTNSELTNVTEKGCKNVFRMGPDSKEQITVLGCVSADGKFNKPFVIFPGVKPNYNLDNINQDSFDLGASPNGRISSEAFYEWLANIFFPCVKDSIAFPIIIFIDGHASLINVTILEFCRENDIILYCFPPRASHVLQPLDVAVYGPLKMFWKTALEEFKRRYQGLSMTKTHFFLVFHSAWEKATFRPQNVMSGFRGCGLVPFNPDNVKYSELIVRNTKVSIKSRRTCDFEEKVVWQLNKRGQHFLKETKVNEEGKDQNKSPKTGKKLMPAKEHDPVEIEDVSRNNDEFQEMRRDIDSASEHVRTIGVEARPEIDTSGHFACDLIVSENETDNNYQHILNESLLPEESAIAGPSNVNSARKKL